MKETLSTGRLESLDILRGFNMFFITGGTPFLTALAWLLTGSKTNWVAMQLTHIPWAASSPFGLHCYDIIFPLFVFITGVTFPFSAGKRLERGDSKSAIASNVVRRMLVLVAIGLVCGKVQDWKWDEFRVWSVVGRVGIVWCGAALCTIFFRLRTCIAIAAAILVGWWALLMFVPAPDAPADLANGLAVPRWCIASWVDRNFLTTAHRGEGGLAVLGMFPTAFFGIWSGMYLRFAKEGLTGNGRTLRMLGVALVALLVGWAWSVPSWGCPIVKGVWTSTYALVSGAYSLALLAVFYWLVDVRGWKRWGFIFKIIGMNGVAAYFGYHFVPFRAIGKYFLGALTTCCGLPGWEQTMLAFGGVAALWITLYFLYRHKIFFKA